MTCEDIVNFVLRRFGRAEPQDEEEHGLLIVNRVHELLEGAHQIDSLQRDSEVKDEGIPIGG